MFDDLRFIINFILEAFLHIWPYLLISIPLAVAIRVTDAKRYIERAFTGHPVKMIILAAIVGAFSPFCSCSVIPVIASLLIAGVPLGPVMTFWIASPSMDPEVFALSVGLIGWNLAVARVIATLVISLSAGFLAHYLQVNGYFKDGIIREQKKNLSWSWRKIFQAIPQFSFSPSRLYFTPVAVTDTGTDSCGCGDTASLISPASIGIADSQSSCGSTCGTTPEAKAVNRDETSANPAENLTFWQQIWKEGLSVTGMIIQFMLIAFILEALILLYVPQEAIVNLLGNNNPLAILCAALVGIPIYTTNLTALPLMSGLLEQGMAPGAALAFLIAGPTTTLPAMAAVYGIARRRVFLLYLSISLIGAIVMGYVYQIFI